MAPISPLVKDTDLVTFTILVADQAIKDSLRVTNLEVERTIEHLPLAKLVVLLEPEEGNAQDKISLSDFPIGKEVEIKVGYHAKEDTVFKGEIRSHRLSINTGVGRELVLNCQGKTIDKKKPAAKKGSADLVLTYGKDVYSFNGEAGVFIFGKVAFVGNANPKINSLIELSEFGAPFDGEVVITGIHHHIAEGRWTTEVDFGFDEAEKVRFLTTPAGSKILLSDDEKKLIIEDQYGNKVEMTEEGILFNSIKDITIKATGKIDIQANQNISVSSKADLVLQGLNVKADAKVAFSAEGKAQAELKAGGQTTVKGAMVMIN